MPDELLVLELLGEVEQPLRLTTADLAALPPEAQVLDVSRFQAGRKGDGVALEALLERARPKATATHVTLHADRDDFHVSVPLEALREQGVVVYKVGDEPLAVAQGGPIRLILRDPASCHTGELDDCANVKYLSRIELTAGRGRDTRPQDEAEHAALHERQGG
jgi:DMSO/TMAO reductase YedYZ molybdopterin-dependent catalytic subunit